MLFPTIVYRVPQIPSQPSSHIMSAINDAAGHHAGPLLSLS